MSFKAIELFSHINALCHQHQLLLKTVIFQLHLGIFQFGHQTLTLPLQNFRHMRTYLRHFSADALQTLLDQGLQCLTFGFTRNDKVIQRTVKRSEDFSGNSIQVLLLGSHYARPAQDINRVNFTFIALHFDPVSSANELFSELFIQDQLTLRTGVWLKTQRTFDFTARQARANTFANHGFKTTELFRQAKISFQITLVYRAHFPGCATPFTLDFTPGVGGHAADHRRSCF